MFTAKDRARFDAKVLKGQPTECWLWTASKNGAGYGQFMILDEGRYRPRLAHRLALKEAIGEPPEGKPMALHSCDNPACCNPAHLRWGNNQDNVTDMLSRNRQVKSDVLSDIMKTFARRGEGHASARLTDEQILKIRADNRIHRLIAADYGITRSYVGALKNNLNRRFHLDR